MPPLDELELLEELELLVLEELELLELDDEALELDDDELLEELELDCEPLPPQAANATSAMAGTAQRLPLAKNLDNIAYDLFIF